jgi:Protein of unknown function (DUF433)
MNYRDRIVRDPQIVGGEPILKGTRVTLKTRSAQDDMPLIEIPIKR